MRNGPAPPDAAANLSVSVARVALPPSLQLFRNYSLTRPAAALFEWRIPCHTIVGQAVEVSFAEISDESAQECPLSVFARYALPPTKESWIAAAGREGGRSSMVVPSKPAEGQKYLFFSAMRVLAATDPIPLTAYGLSNALMGLLRANPGPASAQTLRSCQPFLLLLLCVGVRFVSACPRNLADTVCVNLCNKRSI